MGKAGRLILAAALATLAGRVGTVRAEEPAATPAKQAWSNETEFNWVLTEGNSNTKTVGLKNRLVRRWSGARFEGKLEALRSANSDDWYLQVDPGYTWQPGETPPSATTNRLVKPPTEPDAENYFAEGR